MVCPLLPFLSIVKSGLLLQSCLIGTQPHYTTKPLKLGVEVFDIELKHDIPEETVEIIKDDLSKHRLLVFRNQGIISTERQVEIAKWFGALDSEYVTDHPMTPSPFIARFSNDASQGEQKRGRGWHIDGAYRERPHSAIFFYMVSAPRDGDTRFVGMREVVESLTHKQREQWNRLWVMSKMPGIIHPLLYSHPVTKQPSICIHLRQSTGFTYDYDSDNERLATNKENTDIFNDILDAITKDDERLVYSHKWKEGDLILADNLALGHESSKESHLPVSEVGLRILHRITVAGEHLLEK